MDAYKLLSDLRATSANLNERFGDRAHYFKNVKSVKVARPKSAAQLESLVKELINRTGGKVEIIYAGGRPLVTKDKRTNVLGHEWTQTDVKYIPGSTTPGTPDILGRTHDGKPLAIEVKFSKSDRLSEEQIQWRDEWIQCNDAVYIVAKTLDDVLPIIKKGCI